MNGIVAIGHRAGPFLDLPTHVVHLDTEVLEDLPALHDALAEQVAVHGTVVVVHPARLQARAARSVATVRTALDGAPVLRHATALPPLAADVLVTLAAALHDRVGRTAAVAALLPALERQILCLTWLPTVKGLTDPVPTLAQHAASAVPGRSWLVRSWPRPEILRYDADTLPALPLPGQEVGVALADAGGEVGWVPRIIGALPGAVGLQVPPPPDTDAHWGSRGSTQVVIYPRDVAQLAAALADRVVSASCRWCRRDVATRVCPWCRLPHDGLVRGGAGQGSDRGSMPDGRPGIDARPGDDRPTEAA